LLFSLAGIDRLVAAFRFETCGVPIDLRLASGSFKVLIAAGRQGTGITLQPARYCKGCTR
jgi:hypothetical protein